MVLTGLQLLARLLTLTLELRRSLWLWLAAGGNTGMGE